METKELERLADESLASAVKEDIEKSSAGWYLGIAWGFCVHLEDVKKMAHCTELLDRLWLGRKNLINDYKRLGLNVVESYIEMQDNIRLCKFMPNKSEK